MNVARIHWDEIYDSFKDYLASTTQDINYILSQVSSSAPRTHLDVGCGTGQLCRELFHRGYQSTGIDTSGSAVRLAIEATVCPEITYLHTDLDRFSKNQSATTFGLITCKYVFAFIEDRASFVEAVRQRLVEFGVFVLITPDPQQLPKEKIAISVPHKELIELLGSAFSVKYLTRGRDVYYICTILPKKA